MQSREFIEEVQRSPRIAHSNPSWQNGAVSIGFRPSPPPEPPLEAPLLRVQHKDGREARAVVRSMSHGRELRIYIGDDLRGSRLFPPHEGGQPVLDASNTTLAAFQARGWVRDVTV